MTAGGLATRCPACSTVFRVVPDQLRVSEGWVRCGRCSEVFDASRSLSDIDTGEPRRMDGDAARPLRQPRPPAPRAMPEPEPDWAHVDPDPMPEPAPEQGHEHEALADVDFSAGESSLSPEAATAHVAAGEVTDPRAEPADRPSFVVQAERAARWRRPGVRAALAVALLLGTSGLVAQVGYEYRDLAAARFPAARPLLEQACLALGCTVEAARDIEKLAVESSGLVRVEKSSIYKLQVSLRNRANFELALPALDLSLTDSQGRLIARKTVRVSELGTQQATIGAGREIALQATLQVASSSASAPETIAGYTIDLFYP